MCRITQHLVKLAFEVSEEGMTYSIKDAGTTDYHLEKYGKLDFHATSDTKEFQRIKELKMQAMPHKSKKKQQ